MKRPVTQTNGQSPIRGRWVILPRRGPLMGLVARHMAADENILDEDAETWAKKHRSLRVGKDHFSLVFTHAWMASQGRFIRGPRFLVF